MQQGPKSFWDVQEALLQDSRYLQQVLRELQRTREAPPLAFPTDQADKEAREKEEREKRESKGNAQPPKRKFKWATAVDEHYRFDPRNAVAFPDLSLLPWWNSPSTSQENELVLKGIAFSEGGSEGVFFLDTSQGAVVLKGSRHLATEAFAHLLCLKCHVFSPRLLPVRLQAEGPSAMLAALLDLDQTYLVASKLATQTHVLLKEYVRGCTLSQLFYEKAVALFGEGRFGEVLSSNGTRRLRELGRLLALDVLTNNSDRLPLLWNNRGNGGNLMFAGPNGILVNIDNKVVPINGEAYPKKLEEYMTNVRSLLSTLIKNPLVEHKSFQTIRGQLLSITEYDIGERGCVEMQQGFLQVVHGLRLGDGTEPLGKEEKRSDGEKEGEEEEEILIHLSMEEMMSWVAALRQLESAETEGSLHLNEIGVDFVWNVCQLFAEFKAAAA
ncbi:hypothetical protein QOT17_008932 [Balamuthia mandrillaris]